MDDPNSVYGISCHIRILSEKVVDMPMGATAMVFPATALYHR